MRHALSRSSFVLITIALATGCAHEGTCPAQSTTAATAATAGFSLAEPLTAPPSITVQSADFTEGGTIPDVSVFSGFGCTGGNESPALSWSGAPEGTRSFAVVVHDPDAPTGVGFFHWSLFNIPASTTSLAHGAASTPPEGATSGRTDFGTNTYGGPCPPPGTPHRYAFTVYALDTDRLELDQNASGALLRFMLGQHTLAYGRLVGTYGRAAQ